MSDIRPMHECGNRMEVLRNGFEIPYTPDGKILAFDEIRPIEIDPKQPIQRGDLFRCEKCRTLVILNLTHAIYERNQQVKTNGN